MTKKFRIYLTYSICGFQFSSNSLNLSLELKIPTLQLLQFVEHRQAIFGRLLTIWFLLIELVSEPYKFGLQLVAINIVIRLELEHVIMVITHPYVILCLRCLYLIFSCCCWIVVYILYSQIKENCQLFKQNRDSAIARFDSFFFIKNEYRNSSKKREERTLI